MASIARCSGLYDPDHDSLSNAITGLNQRSVFKGFGFGAAPNVPFFNVNFLTALSNTSAHQSSGSALNLGARWVTMGASLIFSYWGLSSPDASGTTLTTHLVAVTAGIAINRFIWNLEAVSRSQEFAPGAVNSGAVFTSQMKYRLWRENYLKLDYAVANVAMNLQQGASNEAVIGLVSYPIAGLNVDFNLNWRNNKTPQTIQDATMVNVITHVFF